MAEMPELANKRTNKNFWMPHHVTRGYADHRRLPTYPLVPSFTAFPICSALLHSLESSRPISRPSSGTPSPSEPALSGNSLEKPRTPIDYRGTILATAPRIAAALASGYDKMMASFETGLQFHNHGSEHDPGV
jgi:hypothetical protein